MAHAQPLALDHVFAGGGDIEQNVDEMVFEQIDLVDVEKAAMGIGQKPGFETLLATR